MRFLILKILVLLASTFFTLGNAGAQVNLSQGLVAYYPFNGNANDASGNGNHGTPTNGVQLTTDRFGNPNSAYLFDGIDDFIAVANAASLNPSNGLSIALYFNPSASGTQCLVGKIAYTGGVATQYQMAFDYSPQPGVLFGVNPISNGCAGVPVNAAYANTGFPVILNQWHCVVGTFDNGVMKIYLDGVLIETVNAGFSTLNQCSNATMRIGNWWSGDPFQFKGKIDDVRIYNRALNQDEVNALCLTEEIINDYTPALSLDVCKNILTVEDASDFSIGDTVLLIQMKGAAIDSNNTSNFGTITNIKNAGNYEFNYIKSKNGNSLELLNRVIRQYDFPDGFVQLVRVPYFQDYTTRNLLTCLPWDGTKGGVLVFNVQNTLTLNTDIDVSGRGFRKGASANTNNVNWSCNSPDFFYPSGSIHGAAKGEGIVQLSTQRSNGKGPLANGGGGGNQSNAGGGGGGNIGLGGFGGNQFGACTGADGRGMPGKAVNHQALNKIFMGGGGAAGDANNPAPPAMFASNGGNGGGIVIISAGTISSATQPNIKANGDPGLSCNTGNCHEGMGGGGAGGSVLLHANSYSVAGLRIETSGGKGANAIHNSSASPYPHGVGGGGGGGMTWFSSAALPANITVSQPGGAPGVNTNFGNDTWGATAGTAGATFFNLQMPIANTVFKPNIDSVRIRETRLSCSSFSFDGFGFTNTYPVTSWQWYFGDGGTAITQTASHSFNNAGTYPVKLVITDINGCKDSTTIFVNASGLSFDFSYSINPCNPLTVQFNGVGTGFTGIPDGDFGDGSVWTDLLNPLHTYPSAGNYVVAFYVNNGACYDTIRKTISLGVIPDNIVLTNDTTICYGASKQLLTAPALSYCWTPTTWLDNPGSQQPVTSTPHNITYYFTAEVTGNNLISNGDFTQGNTGFTSDYNFASPNTTEGQYFVGSNPQAWNPSLNPCADHTTANGNMLLVNGSPAADVSAWKQTVAVTPNTNYAFSTWIQALINTNPAQLQFSINGKVVGPVITAPLPVCTWTRFYTTWNSGNASTAIISIINKNTLAAGNDFALDDISFAPVFIKRDSVKITVDTANVVTSDDITICRGDSVQLVTTGAQLYAWTPSNGLSNPAIGNPKASPATTTQYIVTGTTQKGCTGKDTVNISLYQVPVMSVSNDTDICRNTSVQLFASGGTTYTWTPAATLDDPTSANPVATPINDTKYYVNIGDANCSYLDSVQVKIIPPPLFTISPVTDLCLGDSVQLHAAGGDIYNWQPSATLTSSTASNPIAFPSINTIYNVTITESACNESTILSTEVRVLPGPTIVANKSNDIDCSYDRSQLIATGGNQYTWTPAGSLNTSTVSNPVASPTATTSYIVRGVDLNGCVAYDTVMVNVDNVNKGGYLMPSAFTPNNDGLNDCYGIKYWGIVYEIEFSIYNRWGERVFYTKNPNGCWDGTYKGTAQDAGVFIYMITAKTNCETRVFRKGTVLLVR